MKNWFHQILWRKQNTDTIFYDILIRCGKQSDSGVTKYVYLYFFSIAATNQTSVLWPSE